MHVVLGNQFRIKTRTARLHPRSGLQGSNKESRARRRRGRGRDEALSRGAFSSLLNYSSASWELCFLPPGAELFYTHTLINERSGAVTLQSIIHTHKHCRRHDTGAHWIMQPLRVKPEVLWRCAAPLTPWTLMCEMSGNSSSYHDGFTTPEHTDMWGCQKPWDPSSLLHTELCLILWMISPSTVSETWSRRVWRHP